MKKIDESSLAPEEKIQRARTSLIILEPFFAAFLLRTNLVENDQKIQPSVTTMATDGTTIWWCREFVQDLDIEECKGVLIHEVLHIILKHHLRLLKRKPKKFNVACDYVINPMVRDHGCNIPVRPDLIMHQSDEYKGYTAEHVYELLPDEPSGKGDGPAGIGDIIEPTNDDGQPMSDEEVKQAEIEIDQNVIIAAETSKAIGRHVPTVLKGYVDSLMEPQVDWSRHLRRFFAGEKPEGYTYQRMQRSIYMQTGMIEPGMEKKGVGHVTIAIDTSGSVSDMELKNFVAEIKNISEEHEPDLITLIQCDSAIRSVEEFERGDPFEALKVKGRGGTRVQPVFKHVADTYDTLPDKLIYLTDMGIPDWGSDPGYPVLWVSTAKNATAPYGETTHIQVRKDK